jgi:hypothetical protein
MLAAKLGGTNPKNYQVWYHRRNLLEQSFSDIKSASGTDEVGNALELVNEEIEYIATVIAEDAKNYHVSAKYCMCRETTAPRTQFILTEFFAIKHFFVHIGLVASTVDFKSNQYGK